MSSESDGTEYTIDELAAVSRVPSRTIRFYQSKGALRGPQIKGRVAFYGPEHVERLKLIAQLQDRGLRIDAIRDLASRIDRGELDANEWLGLEQALQAPWAHDQARTVTEAELHELAGTHRVGLIGDLVAARLVERHKDVYLVKSPALLQVVMRLEGAGVDLEHAARGGEIIRKHMAKVASDLSEYYFKHAADFGQTGESRDLAGAFQALRPMGMEAVRVIFGQEMEKVLRRLVESGKSARLPAAKKKPKPRG